VKFESMMTGKYFIVIKEKNYRLLIRNRFLDIGDLAILICDGLQKDESLILWRLADLHHVLLSSDIDNFKNNRLFR
jgi:hypothetical protein